MAESVKNLPDVSDLYRAMHIADRDQLQEIKRIGILLGHSGVIEEASGRLGEAPTQEEISSALHNAVGVRGWTINQERTAVGEFYQKLFGRDFDGAGATIQLKDGRGGRFTYETLENGDRYSDELDAVNHKILKAHDFESHEPTPRNEMFVGAKVNAYLFGMPRLVDWDVGYVSAEFPFGTMVAYVSGTDGKGKPVISVDYFGVDGKFERLTIGEDGAKASMRGRYDPENPDGLTYLHVPVSNGISNRDVALHLINLVKPDLEYFDRPQTIH